MLPNKSRTYAGTEVLTSNDYTWISLNEYTRKLAPYGPISNRIIQKLACNAQYVNPKHLDTFGDIEGKDACIEPSAKFT